MMPLLRISLLLTLISILGCERDGRPGLSYILIDYEGNMVRQTPEPWLQEFCTGIESMLSDDPWLRAICANADNGIPLELRAMLQFAEGLVPWRTKEGYTILNAEGKKTTSSWLDFDTISPFSEGLARVSKRNESREGKCGFIDAAGEVVIPVQFDGAFSFSQGLAVVRQGEKMGAIDKSGNFVIKPKFQILGTFSEDLALAEEYVLGESYTGGYVDRSGTYKVLLPSPLQPLSGFSDGLALVRIHPDTLAFIDTSGTVKLKLAEFEEAFGFSEGRAAVIQNGKWGYVDTNGNVVIKPQYLSAYDFTGGVALVVKEDKPK